MAKVYLHETVLKNEAVDALNVSEDGVYIDATFGRGGHSRLILQRLSKEGKLVVLDCDPEAIEHANALAQEDTRVIVWHTEFGKLKQKAQAEGIETVDGILFDFGVSSPQIDQAQRGFSFQRSGPLDMRMDNSTGETAAEWLQRASLQEMKHVFWRYGEEKNAHRIAKKIVETRELQPLTTTDELASLVAGINVRDRKNPATRVFQAIRIYINEELTQIEDVLPDAFGLLKQGGRLVVISFHSLEDRLVKRFFKQQSKSTQPDRRMPVELPENEPLMKLVGKPVKAVDIDENIRARSAIMRVAEKK